MTFSIQKNERKSNDLGPIEILHQPQLIWRFFLLRECSGSPHFAGQSGPRHTNETSIRYTIRFRLLFAPRWIAQKRNWWRFHIFRLLETKSKNPMRKNCFKSSRRWASWGGVVNLPRWSKLHQIPERSFREIWHEKTTTIRAMAVSQRSPVVAVSLLEDAEGAKRPWYCWWFRNPSITNWGW